MSEISGKFAVKNLPNRLIESPIFKRRRFLVQRQEVDENIHQPFRPKNLYNELSRKSIPLRKGRKSQKNSTEETSQKGLSESDRQMIKNLDSRIPERILVLATPQKKVRASSIIFQSG